MQNPGAVNETAPGFYKLYTQSIRFSYSLCVDSKTDSAT